METVSITKQSVTQSIQEQVEKIVKILQAGGLIIFPTETCYGVGVDATNQTAVNKLLEYKSRREGKPISIAVSDRSMAEKYVEINEIAVNLYDNYLPGPITVVSKSLGNVAKGLESEFGTLGIRIPDYKLILDILKAFGKPITATSANMSYKPRPYSIEKLLNDLPKKQKDLIDLVIDAGELPMNEPSTVVDTTLNNLNIMRKGKLKLKDITEGVDPVLEATTDSAEETEAFGGLCMLKYFDTPIEKPLVFLLNGELGAGKTQFTKGVAKKLGIKQIVKSPTFNILNEYRYELADRVGKLIHVDTWRLESPKDFTAVGLYEVITSGNVIAIEWSDKFLNDLIKLCKEKNAVVCNVVFEYLSEEKRSIKLYN